MKKIVSLVLVVAIVFSFTGTAMAKSNSASDQHALALRVMKSEATRLAGKTLLNRQLSSTRKQITTLRH